MRGFTLIEIIVAVLISTLAAMAVLSVGIQSAKVSDRLKKRAAISAPLSIAALHGKLEFSGTERTLESFLMNAYAIDYDPLKEYLNSRQIYYKEEITGRWSLLGESADETLAEFGGATSHPDLNQIRMPRFEIVERSVAAGGIEARVYVLRREN
jgi:prepilin-type N-terminal cleavage/methylation domain-containing protein